MHNYSSLAKNVSFFSLFLLWPKYYYIPRKKKSLQLTFSKNQGKKFQEFWILRFTNGGTVGRLVIVENSGTWYNRCPCVISIFRG